MEGAAVGCGTNVAVGTAAGAGRVAADPAEATRGLAGCFPVMSLPACGPRLLFELLDPQTPRAHLLDMARPYP